LLIDLIHYTAFTILKKKDVFVKEDGIPDLFLQGKSSTTAILILTNLGATTESCPYKYGKYLLIIGDFMGVGAGLRARPVKISFS
jgi:hypothetical protein